MVVQSASRGRNKNTGNTMADTSGGPTEAFIQLIAPDGYYTYLGIPKPTAADIQAAAEDIHSSFVSQKTQDQNASRGKKFDVDEDLVKKNYRKLSLKHHPDRDGGDAETFRLLNRAHKVLTNPKLRKQYDILGLDLDEDEDENNLHAGGSQDDGEDKDDANQGIVHEIATMVMAAIMHLGVRTAMTCAVSTLVTRYRLTLIPALLFMLYVVYNQFLATRLPDSHPAKASIHSIVGPVFMMLGLVFMYFGRTYSIPEGSTEPEAQWTFLFWVGESLVIGMFTYNSISASLHSSPVLFGSIAVFAILIALWFRGYFWNYVTIMVFELGLIIFVVVAFPMMEMILETILNEKLRKVGDKVRAHQKQLEAYYAKRAAERKLNNKP